MTTEDRDNVQVVLRFQWELVRKLRHIAADEDRTTSGLITTLVLDYAQGIEQPDFDPEDDNSGDDESDDEDDDQLAGASDGEVAP
jgi:hypothetical protein